MTEINRSSLLAKLKHIKGMKLLVEQAVLLYLLMADEQTPVWVKTIVVSALVTVHRDGVDSTNSSGNG